MAEYPAKLERILENFRLLQDRSQRIEVLISMADRFKTVPGHIAERPFPEENRVKSCESEAYVFTEELPDHTLRFHFAVENPQGISAMAIAVLLDRGLSGQPLDQVAKVPYDIVFEIFGNELSTGKGLGLTGIVSMVQHAAKRQASELQSVPHPS
ncbi:MAG: SufE family protein [Acidobacteriota bacterium]